MRTRRSFRPLAIVIGLVAGLAAAEGILRLAVHFNSPLVGSFAAFIRSPEGGQSHNPKYRKSDDPLLGWELAPAVAEGIVRINADGFRGPEYPREPSPGIQRVAVIGDSEAFAGNLSESDTLSGSMQRELNKTSATPWEVLNFGVSGYNTVQESRLLERKVLQYRPSIVVLYYVFNDPVISPRSFLFAKSPFGRLFIVTLAEWYAFRRLRMHDIASSYLNDVAADPVGYYRWLHNSEYFDISTALVRKMARVTRNHGARFVLVIAPEIFGIDDFTNYPYYALHDKLKMLSSPDIEVVDPLQEVIALTNNPNELWVTDEDPHKNKAATAAIASSVARAILGQKN